MRGNACARGCNSALRRMDWYESELSVAAEEIAFELRGFCAVPWADFLLNPRRLRGSDFLMRWSQGVWSEKRIIQALGETQRYFAVPYGPSGTAPSDDPRAHELYFERLKQAGLGGLKRPDVLIFMNADDNIVRTLVRDLGGIEELPFTPEEDPRMCELLQRAVLGIECENSLWQAAQMPDYGSPLTPQRRLGGQLGLKKTAIVPTVILKEQDRAPVLEWQGLRGVKVHIWHLFYDLAFGLSLDSAEEAIHSGKIEPSDQTFQAPGGATTRKTIYKIYYHYAYPLGEAVEQPQLVAEFIIDRNGHILPYVRFEGGSMAMSPKAVQVLDQAWSERGR